MKKTAEGLVAHVKKCLADGWGYVYGSLGQICTDSLLDYCAAVYPAGNLAGGYMREAGRKWLGKNVADCSGIIKAYLMSDYTGGPIRYDPKIDSSVHYRKAKEKGIIDTLPEIPGILVYMPGHVGVYIGNGAVIESAGTLYGVKKSTVLRSYTGSKWTHWYKCPGIEYPAKIERPESAGKPVFKPKPIKPTKKISVEYQVRGTRGIWYPKVKDLKDYAGVKNEPITDVAIKASTGKIKYRVHIFGGDWLPWVTGCDIHDHENGYAGDSKPIDAVEIIYSGGKKAKYRVSQLGRTYWPWQYDNEKINGQDGYAGSFSRKIDRLQIEIK